MHWRHEEVDVAMNLNDLASVWVLIKPSIEDGDPREAADVLVNHLIDDGMTAHRNQKSLWQR